MSPLSIRPATADDLGALHPLIQRAYRGDASRAGWTHEADLVEGERIAVTELAAMIDDPTERLLIAVCDGVPIGCVRVARVRDDLAYLGLLCVDPLLQAGGIGNRLIMAAEDTARTAFGAGRIEMTVIDSRSELIAYYARRGYLPVGDRAFPITVNPPLHMVVLEKALT